MSGAKETPRQKMIGMMYLVLTALLALNVSKDILNAFVIVNKGLQTSQDNTASKNNTIYANFDKAYLSNKQKVKPYLDKAYQAQKFANDLSKYIAHLRTEIIAYTEYQIKDGSTKPELWKKADTISLKDVDSKDNYDKPMEILVGLTEDCANGEGMVLKKKFEQFKKDMISLVSDKDKAALVKSFPINTDDEYDKEEHKKINWVEHNFHHTVLAADVAILNKFLVDVKTVEGDVIAKLYSAVDAGDFKFDTLVAKVVSPSSYLLSGSEYRANIFVAAMDTKKDPEIYIGDTLTHANGKKLDKFDHGMGVYTDNGGIGEHKYTGWISVLKPGEATPRVYNFASSYTVGAPSATISADKMNVFYIGVDNPVTISVPGVPSNDVHPNMTAGTLTPAQGPGKYIVRVSTIGETTINVAAQMGGKTQTMGSSKFRVKRIPDPVALVGGVKSGLINRNVIAASHMVVAKLENFDFDLNFTVTSYTFLINIKGDIIPTPVSGFNINADVIAKITHASPGTRVYFEDIKARGPDGTVRNLSPVNLKLQ